MKNAFYKNLVFLLASLLLLPPVLAFAMGAVWGIVDWLRNYGTGISPFPYFDHPQFQIEDIINWYNSTFRGATRFGSGLGFIAGAFIVIGLFKEQRLPVRLLVGVATGMMIGTRSVLMLGSGAPLFVVGMIAGGIIGAINMAIGEAAGKALPLPIKKVA
jgi:apolipoprotein N-acyltransferase